MKGEKRTISLVLLALTVRQIVADKPGGDAVSVLAAEVSRLLDSYMEIQGPELLTWICNYVDDDQDDD